MKHTATPRDLTPAIDLALVETDIVVVDESETPFEPIPHGLILRTSPGPVYVMGGDGKWHRHSTVRS